MEALKFIADQMAALEIPYEFGEWTSDVKYPYFVGEIIEEPTDTEDGAESSSVILVGFHKGKYITLEEIKEKIKKHFPAKGGLRSSTDSGAIAVFYGSARPIPTGEADLKRIEITLNIKEWKGDM